MSPSLTWPKPWPPSSGSAGARPTGRGPLTCVLQRGGGAPQIPPSPTPPHSVSSGQICSRDERSASTPAWPRTRVRCRSPTLIAVPTLPVAASSRRRSNVQTADPARAGARMSRPQPARAGARMSRPRNGRLGYFSSRACREEPTMSQQHLDRLTSIDASFLHQEGRGIAHAHRRACCMFEGPAAGLCRRTWITCAAGCIWFPATARSWPPRRWRRDALCGSTIQDFNLDYHVRHAALPAPGTEEQLFLLVSRTRLPTAWIAIQAAVGDAGWSRVWPTAALPSCSKTHHSLVDGVAGVDLATVLFDLEREPRGNPAPIRRTHSSPGRPAARAVRSSSWSWPACAGWSTRPPLGLTARAIGRCRPAGHLG